MRTYNLQHLSILKIHTKKICRKYKMQEIQNTGFCFIYYRKHTILRGINPIQNKKDIKIQIREGTKNQKVQHTGKAKYKRIRKF